MPACWTDRVSEAILPKMWAVNGKQGRFLLAKILLPLTACKSFGWCGFLKKLVDFYAYVMYNGIKFIWRCFL